MSSPKLLENLQRKLPITSPKSSIQRGTLEQKKEKKRKKTHYFLILFTLPLLRTLDIYFRVELAKKTTI